LSLPSEPVQQGGNPVERPGPEEFAALSGCEPAGWDTGKGIQGHAVKSPQQRLDNFPGGEI